VGGVRSRARRNLVVLWVAILATPLILVAVIYLFYIVVVLAGGGGD
jgi:hypothetical protein